MQNDICECPENRGGDACDCLNYMDEHDELPSCAEAIENQNSCEDFFCPSCDWAGFCDLQCGVCGETYLTGNPATGGCYNLLDFTAISSSSVDLTLTSSCSTAVLEDPSACENSYCPDCDLAGYCDLECGYGSCVEEEQDPEPIKELS